MSTAPAEREIINQRQQRWYLAVVSSAHEGAGRRGDHAICLKAGDTIEALDRVNQFPGWKRNMSGSEPFPEIRELSAEEAQVLERAIRDARFSLARAETIGIDTRILEQARRR
jgi:hypothetical protein